jgi:dCMP deaminase
MNYNPLMRRAYVQATSSQDPSTQNGAIVLDEYGTIIGEAANNFPVWVKETPERWERPAKYFYVEHAERNAIFDVLTSGMDIPHTMVCPWAACADCARAIVLSGVQVLVRMPHPLDLTNDRWNATCVAGDEIMMESGVRIIELDYKHTGKPIMLRRNGEELVIK